MKNFEETKNNSYWLEFYSDKKEDSKADPTDFAVFSYHYIEDNFKGNINNLKMIDIGCGNGRDVFFFRENGLEAIGVDANFPHDSEHIVRGCALKILDQRIGYDIYYARFFLHTIPEFKLNDLLLKISQKMNVNSIFLFETRSSLDHGSGDKMVTNFKGPVGDKHYRFLYSKSYLEDKINNNFRILYSEENTGLAEYRGEDPTVIRMILGKK